MPFTKGKRVEAREWFKGKLSIYPFASNHFCGTRGQGAQRHIKALYAAGALKVEVGEIQEEPWRIEEDGGPYAATLYITLPMDAAARLAVETVAKSEKPDEYDVTGNELRVWWD